MFNQIVPAFTIVIFSMALLIRVLLQKSITFIYLIFNISFSLFYLAYHIGISTAIHPDISFYLVGFAYDLAFLFLSSMQVR